MFEKLKKLHKAGKILKVIPPTFANIKMFLFSSRLEPTPLLLSPCHQDGKSPLTIRSTGGDVAGCRLRWQLVFSRIQLRHSPWYASNKLKKGLTVQKPQKMNYKLLLL